MAKAIQRPRRSTLASMSIRDKGKKFFIFYREKIKIIGTQRWIFVGISHNIAGFGIGFFGISYPDLEGFGSEIFIFG